MLSLNAPSVPTSENRPMTDNEKREAAEFWKEQTELLKKDVLHKRRLCAYICLCFAATLIVAGILAPVMLIFG